jgi:hypothetical protein
VCERGVGQKYDAYSRILGEMGSALEWPDGRVPPVDVLRDDGLSESVPRAWWVSKVGDSNEDRKGPSLRLGDILRLPCMAAQNEDTLVAILGDETLHGRVGHDELGWADLVLGKVSAGMPNTSGMDLTSTSSSRLRSWAFSSSVIPPPLVRRMNGEGLEDRRS